MTDFEKCKRAFEIGAGKEKIAVWVKAGKITQAEYEEITGEGYANEE